MTSIPLPRSHYFLWQTGPTSLALQQRSPFFAEPVLNMGLAPYGSNMNLSVMAVPPAARKIMAEQSKRS